MGRLSRGRSISTMFPLAAFSLIAVAQADTWETAAVEVDGATLTYESAGNVEHEAVLLIAGTGMQLIDWPDELVEQLVKQGYRVVRFDNRDVGLTTMPDDFEPVDEIAIAEALIAGQPAPIPYDFYDMAADAIGLMDALSVEQAHIVGISMGGAIALLLAIDSPERVASLTLLAADSGNPELPMLADPEAFANLPPPPAPGDWEALLDYRVAVAQVLAGAEYPMDEGTARAQERRAMERAFNPQALARQEAISFVGHLESAAYRFSNLENIAAPTVVLHGTDDPLVPVEAAHDLADRIPDAELRIVSGWGHDIPVRLVPDIVDAILAVAGRAATVSAED